MKKLSLIILTIFAFTSTAYADNDKIITVSQLPAPAQAFIKAHFPTAKALYAKMERDLFEKTTYEVVFERGIKVEFDREGQWEEVDCEYSAVPTAIVPAQISTYVKNNFSGGLIVQIDKDKRDYEVKLNNGLELTFDLKFNLIEMDD